MGSRTSRFAIAVVAATAAFLAVPAASSSAGQPSGDPRAERAGERGKPAAAPTTSPQPPSKADGNPGGANNGGDCGAYCSTRDGSPSRNGKGGKDDTGKPCAGCVGKADNKNPPGQAPSGADGNAGYECDRNQGVGQGNPAHTGCTTPAAPPAGTPPAITPPVGPPPLAVPSGSPATPPVRATPPARPRVRPGSPGAVRPTVRPSVLGVKVVRPRPNPPAVAGGRLPTTGATVSVGLLLLAGLGALAGGTALTVVSPTRQG